MPRQATAMFSDAELSVLAQRARGLTNRQVAEKLHIDVRTVRTHITRMGRRHDTERVPALIHIACRQGVLQRWWTPDKPRRRRITARQQDILEGLADGLSYAEIAARHGIGTETVRTTIKRLYYGLSARNADHAVAVAWQAGFLGDGSPEPEAEPIQLLPRPAKGDFLDLLLAGV